MTAATSLDPSETASPAEHMRTTMTAVRLRTHSLGVKKTLSRDQTERAAESFDAEGDALSVAKRLLNTKHPAYRAVTRARNDIVSYWKGMTLPFPEAGTRLIRQNHVESFNARAASMCELLYEAVGNLDLVYGELREAARRRLGDLYNAADYPATLLGAFSVAWDFPSVEPPAYLRHLAPDVYEAESRRVAQRFEAAVQLAESAFTEEFGKLVDHLVERLTGHGEDGKPKTFRDSAVTNLRGFFERFRSLNVRSNAELDDLVENAQLALAGVGAGELRKSVFKRQRIADRLSEVKDTLDAMMVDRPRRRIIRSNDQGAA